MIREDARNPRPKKTSNRSGFKKKKNIEHRTSNIEF